MKLHYGTPVIIVRQNSYFTGALGYIVSDNDTQALTIVHITECGAPGVVGRDFLFDGVDVARATPLMLLAGQAE